MKFTKRDLVQRISQDTDLVQHDVRTVIQQFIKNLRTALGRKETVEFRDFGVFKIKRAHHRPGRNLRTGAKLDVPSRLIVKFKTGKELDQKLNAKTPSERTDIS